jgi:hypothetical protein
MRKATAKKTPAKKTPVKKRATKKVEEKSTQNKTIPKWSFDDQGLRYGVDYAFSEDGRIDWRKMIDNKHISLNREKFLKKSEPIDLDSLSKEELDDLKSKARDEDLIIKLWGYRELAELRGFSNVSERVVSSGPDFACVECTITWLPNIETGFREVSFSASADAHIGNCSKDFGANYLTTIASNRAFARAVRNFLRIFIVSQDEISFEKPEEITTSVGVKPSSILEERLEKMNLTFEDFKEKLATEDYEFVGVEAWKKAADIQPKFYPLIFGCLSRWKKD